MFFAISVVVYRMQCINKSYSVYIIHISAVVRKLLTVFADYVAMDQVIVRLNASSSNRRKANDLPGLPLPTDLGSFSFRAQIKPTSQ